MADKNNNKKILKHKQKVHEYLLKYKCNEDNKDNIVDVKWENNDLLIFNNRKLIHTSTPTLEYKDNERLYYSCFLGTKSPIIQV